MNGSAAFAKPAKTKIIKIEKMFIKAFIVDFFNE